MTEDEALRLMDEQARAIREELASEFGHYDAYSVDAEITLDDLCLDDADDLCLDDDDLYPVEDDAQADETSTVMIEWFQKQREYLGRRLSRNELKEYRLLDCNEPERLFNLMAFLDGTLPDLEVSLVAIGHWPAQKDSFESDRESLISAIRSKLEEAQGSALGWVLHWSLRDAIASHAMETLVPDLRELSLQAEGFNLGWEAQMLRLVADCLYELV